MDTKDFEAFKKAWSDYPTQDNEGYQPDRGGFKCGWFAALEYAKEQLAHMREADELRKQAYAEQKEATETALAAGRKLEEQLSAARASNAVLRGALRYSADSLDALLENDEVECRADEDCDHCVALDSQRSTKHALSQDPEGAQALDAIRAAMEALEQIKFNNVPELSSDERGAYSYQVKASNALSALRKAFGGGT